MGEAFGLMQDVPRQGGFGPATDGRWVSKGGYDHPAAGWGAAFSVADVLIRTREPFAGTKAMFVMNHPGRGYDCPGCAWPDDKGVTLDICENGIKHVTWEMTHKRVGREFFQNHTVTELANWTDFDLEDQGRLTEPMVYNAATDRYEPISWDDAFAMIGEQLRALESPDQAAFYTSGRLSNEASFLYQLFSREYGTNNLPDCSNMCHEASGRALTASIATGKGTADLEDWDQCDALFVMGVNAASNAPRMLTTLAAAVDRGAQVVHVNPLIEAGATRTIVPHEIIDMATLHTTPTSTDNLQVRPGDDFALIRGMAKVVFEAAESDPKEETRPLLKEISWVGGFLDGVTIPLSPDLTALIGGRGTGKSTAIESLRYVLGLMPIGASAKADHEAIVSSVLRAGTVVKLTVEATSPRVQTFTIERSVNNTPVVKDASGTVTSLQSADVIGDVEIFGQHELAELASDSEKVASMLHRFQGNGDLTADHKETLARLKENRDKLTRAEKDKVELEDELTDIPRLEEQVRHFKETDLDISSSW